MDPKNPNTLDPKLREVYDRVMKTQVLPPPPAPRVSEPVKPQAPAPLPLSPVEKPSAEPEKQPVSSQASAFIAKPTKEAKKGSKVTGVILIMVILIFLVAYSIFWIKFFNISLPFELPF